MAQGNGGIIGPVKCVSTPTTKNTTVTATGCFTRHNCTVSSANVLVTVSYTHLTLPTKRIV